jgi:hypothetical protein
MTNRRFILIIEALCIWLFFTPTVASPIDQETNRIIAHINQNFALIDPEINTRKQNLSPIFLYHYNSTKRIFEDLRKAAESNVPTDNQQRLIKQLKNIEAETNIWAAFIASAPLSDRATRKVKFDTQIDGKSTCGWVVGWISLGRDGFYEPEYFNQYSTALPIGDPKELSIGEYVVYFYDPQRPDTKYKKEDITLTSDSDEVEIIPIEVPYKTRIKVAKCPRK